MYGEWVGWCLKKSLGEAFEEGMSNKEGFVMAAMTFMKRLPDDAPVPPSIPPKEGEVYKVDNWVNDMARLSFLMEDYASLFDAINESALAAKMRRRWYDWFGDNSDIYGELEGIMSWKDATDSRTFSGYGSAGPAYSERLKKLVTAMKETKHSWSFLD